MSAFVVPKVRKRNGDGHEKKVEEAVGKQNPTTNMTPQIIR